MTVMTYSEAEMAGMSCAAVWASISSMAGNSLHQLFVGLK
jgi:hypothetical protein